VTEVRQDSVLVVRVALGDSDPEIWRRFELRSSLALSQVHQVLQTAFGWEDMHLHRQAGGGLLPESAAGTGIRRGRSMSTTSVTAGCTGSNWLSLRPATKDSPPARFIDGARRGRLEDSGGFPGHEEILDALADTSVADMTGSDAPFDPAFLHLRREPALDERLQDPEQGENRRNRR
jgi:hypothetical protein